MFHNEGIVLDAPFLELRQLADVLADLLILLLKLVQVDCDLNA